MTLPRFDVHRGVGNSSVNRGHDEDWIGDVCDESSLITADRSSGSAQLRRSSCMSSTKTFFAQTRWRLYWGRSASGLFALLLAYVAIPMPVRAGEFEYQQCVQHYCTSYGKSENECVNLCLPDLNGPNKTMPLTPVPTLYGAIAVETSTLASGYAKDQPSLADAERQALAMCRGAGGSNAGCKIVVSGHNFCAALSTGQTGNGGENRWGYAWSDDGWVSRRDATAACRNDGGANCKVAITFCTG